LEDAQKPSLRRVGFKKGKKSFKKKLRDPKNSFGLAFQKGGLRRTLP